MDQLKEKIEKIADLLEQSDYVVALTGAGVSTESGIPDFRSPVDGLWTVVDPELFTIQGFKANPAAFYRAGAPFFRQIDRAGPNPTHTGLAELEKRGQLKAVITQNVDGLHQKGGSSQVLEIHGTLSSASCTHCGRQVPAGEVLNDVEEGVLPPLCSECGEVMKPDVVLFGEQLASDYLLALDEAHKADLIMIVGSSMEVSPANQIPSFCENLVIINRTHTFYDQKALVTVSENTSHVMKLLLEKLDGRKKD